VPAAVALGGAPLHAQTPPAVWPARPITLVQGFAPGGNADTVARLIAARLQEGLGQPVLVEPRTGAGGNVAAAWVARARPDGHTLILLTGAHAVSAAHYRTLAYRPIEDFDMISTVSVFPLVVAVRKDHPARTLRELLDQARGNPQGITFSSVGVGSTQHLAGELLGLSAGVRLQHVPYRGGAAPVQGVLAGDVDLLVDTPTVSLPHVRSGALRALAVTSDTAWGPLPGVPPAAQTLPGFEVRSWLGVAAPAGLPAEVRQRLHTEMVKVLARPDVREQLLTLGSEARASTPDQMRQMVETEIVRWRRVIQDAAIAPAQ
jgi:tripartite-type tricarboxylate transporter receptor subunit TctC